MPEPRKRGEIAAAVDRVLANQPEGLPLAGIQSGVEALLGSVPGGSIRAYLARNASTWHEQRSTRYTILGRGRYRLSVLDQPAPLIDLLMELRAFGAGLRVEPLGEDSWQIFYTSDGIDQRRLAKGKSINETAEKALAALLHEMAAERRLWLITGVPGTGKTTFADYLADEWGFFHLDFETPEGRFNFSRAYESGLDVVITWGFMPDKELHTVEGLHGVGFRWFWFDGDREAAHRAYSRRGTASEEAWQAQLARIAEHIDPRLHELGAERTNVFDAEGNHRLTTDIWNEIAG